MITVCTTFSGLSSRAPFTALLDGAQRRGGSGIDTLGVASGGPVLAWMVGMRCVFESPYWFRYALAGVWWCVLREIPRRKMSRTWRRNFRPGSVVADRGLAGLGWAGLWLSERRRW